jgi:hypothetical protein
MKTLNEYLQKHTLIAALLVTTLAGCDGQETKSPEEALTTPKVVESKPTPAPAVTAAPIPNPVTQATPLTPTAPAKPPVLMSNDKSGLVNIAVGKKTKQSSDAYGGISSRAVDGNVDGDFNHSSVTHTSGKEPQGWLELDLGETENIDHIVIWNRTGCCEDRLSNYWVFVSDKPFKDTDTINSIKNNKAIIAIKGGQANPSFATGQGIGKGRYVRVQLDGNSAAQTPLSLAELEVYRSR